MPRRSPFSGRPEVPILNRESPQAQGLVALWPMLVGLPWQHELVGQQVTASGTGVTSTPGLLGLSAVSDASSTGQLLPIPSAVLAKIATEATLAVWAKSRLGTPTDGSKSGCPVDIQGSINGSHYTWTDGTFYISTLSSARKTFSSPSGLERDKWHLWVVTSKPGTAGWRCLFNGQLAATDTGDATIATSSGAYIGGSSGSVAGGPYLWDGAVAHVALWNRALSDSAVWSLYDPATRWDLYWTKKKSIFVPSGIVFGAEFDASITASAAVAGNLTTAISLASSVSGAATVSASLTTAIRPAASVSATATVAGALTTAIRCAAAVSGTATASASLTTQKRLNASIAASATVSGALTMAIRFAAGLTASATTAGALSTAIQMAAGVSAAASVSGSFGIVARFDAAISSAAEVTGDLTTDIQMAAVISASSLVEAYLSAVSQFTADLSATAFAEGTLVSNPLVGTLQGPRVFTRGDLDSSPSPTVGALRDPRGHTVGNLY